ncbi:hypothetical protein [Kibdelosporangium aridum]|uniref:Lipoprotein n=1 Tax=Kibdelosporangium aridum TaxID=2030 RepID=A0A1W2FMZ8_KIBAR|nr:hypothetical protein [Kibdelosporangium aridum]SMD23006.1 hypothetical protein SAMN05661093_07787 [Kibdelosporangium aridum]
MIKKLAGPVALLAILAACSTPEQKPPQIASLNTTNAGAAAPTTTAPTEERPRLRLDMSREDADALYEVLARCLAEHGVDKKKFETEGVPSKQVMDAAEKACESKQPLPPWEKDVKNPEALDFANRVVQCLRGKGVRYVEVVNNTNDAQVNVAFGGPNNDQDSITKGMEFVEACEREASRK